MPASILIEAFEGNDAKMKKLAVIAISSVLVLSGGNMASATDEDPLDADPNHVTSPYEGPTEVTDWADASSAVPLSGTSDQVDTDGPEIGTRCIVCGAPVRKAVKVSGPTLISKKFVKYLTGAWAKSTGYSWSESTTVNSSIDASVGVSAGTASGNIGVSSSQTKSYSITVNIAASSSKYSKLGLASNFNRYYVKSAMHQNGKPLPGAAWAYGYLYSPTKDQYLVVYYQ